MFRLGRDAFADYNPSRWRALWRRPASQRRPALPSSLRSNLRRWAFSAC